MKHVCVLLAALCLVAYLSPSASAGRAPVAQEIMRGVNSPGGICVVIGGQDTDLALMLADDRFVVHVLCDDRGQLAKARQDIRAAGKYGIVSADYCDSRQLPYAENLINLVVVDGPLSERGLPLSELHRVIAPLGTLSISGSVASEEQIVAAGFEKPREAEEAKGWFVATKPWPKEIDEWPHHLHGPDGNPVANDLEVGPPKHYRWISDPVWMQSHESDSSLRCLVTARGRMYYIANEAPTSLAGPESPPDKWFLTARDAFNGVLLWKIPIKQWGWREWKPSWFTPRPGVIPINLDKRVVAADDKLYATLGYRAPVSEIDGRSGKVLKTYDGTDRTAEIIHRNGQLLLTVLQGERAVVKRIDAKSGEVLWTSDKDYGGTITDYYRFTAMRGRVPEAKVDPTLDIATDGNVVGLLDGDSVACLDFDTGKEKWRVGFPLVEADYNAGNIRAREKVWTGTMIVSDGVLLHASPNQLAAFATDTGKILWTQPKKFLQHLWYEWKDVFVIDGLVWTWSSELVRERLEGLKAGMSSWPQSLNGYDLQTGSLKREVALGKIFKTHHHHRCYRNKATIRYVLASRRGTEFVDITGKNHSVHNWVRGICHMGMVPANGLQYAPPHPCQCYIDEKLNAMNALAASRAPRKETSNRPWLDRGPAFSNAASSNAIQATAGDWPTFRADAGRTGSVNTRLPSEMKLLWEVKLGNRVGAPISVGNRVFVPLVDEHQVVAIDAAQGKEIWRFTTGARIDSPPTYDQGALIFGSADGCVYRVNAEDGQLAWRLRIVPEDRRIAAFGQFESAWPVSGSVLVDSDPTINSGHAVAYFVAGRSSHLDEGLRLCAVDATTGQIQKMKIMAGPEYTVDNIEQNYLLPMGLLPDILRKEESRLFMRSLPFDRQLQQQQGVPDMKLRGGFLDDAYFKRMPWSMGKSGHARFLVHDARHAFCLRMFDSMQGLDPKVFFTPGRAGYLLFAHDLKSRKNVWQLRVPIRGRAMAVTDGELVVAGPPDLVEAADPLAAFEGRKGGMLRVVDKTNGETISEQPISMPPVFNGAAVANGKLFLALEDGSVACFGE